jgi:nucleotide-binding universal stress UspA family protein
MARPSRDTWGPFVTGSTVRAKRTLYTSEASGTTLGCDVREFVVSATASGENVRRIVVGVDGSKASREALRWAAALAPALSARIEAILVWDPMAVYAWGVRAVMASPRHPELESWLAQTVDEVFGDARPPGLTTRIVEASAAAGLLAAARDADMIIVGSRGRGGFAGLLLGSVSGRVAEHATCPVLVVRGEGPPPASADDPVATSGAVPEPTTDRREAAPACVS